jgi:hypothetical protein
MLLLQLLGRGRSLRGVIIVLGDLALGLGDGRLGGLGGALTRSLGGDGSSLGSSAARAGAGSVALLLAKLLQVLS